MTYFPNGTQVVVSDEPFYAYSCWDFCKACNEYEDPETKKIVGVNGCTDWFVPSIAECEALYKSGIWGTLNTWVDTTKYDSNTNSALWSSSAGSGTDLAWYWGVYASGSNAGTDKRNNRNNDRFLAVVRAF